MPRFEYSIYEISDNAQKVSNTFNDLGASGWRFICFKDNLAIFEAPLRDLDTDYKYVKPNSFKRRIIK